MGFRVENSWESVLDQGVFLWTLRVCTLGFWVPKPWNMALNKGSWDPKLRGTNIKGTNSKSLVIFVPKPCTRSPLGYKLKVFDLRFARESGSRFRVWGGSVQGFRV